MQIHVVQSGQSLWQIAQAYSINANEITTANELEFPNQLVVGQALVIPITGRYHWVTPGENLYGISQRYQIPLQTLLAFNNLNTNNLPVGYRLYIPANPENRRQADVGAYLSMEISGANAANDVDAVGEHLSYLPIFSYNIQPDGSLSSLNEEQVIQTAYRHQVAPLLVLTNLQEGGFSTELITQILQDESLQNKVLDEVEVIMEQKGYLGLDLDLEYVGAENREAYNQFLLKARERMDARGNWLSSALPPKTSADMQGVLYEGADYRFHGEVNDFVFLMTYEWGWTGGPPMAVAPLNQVRRVLDYAVSEIPNEKIILGIPLYGYDWTLPFVEGESRARAIDHQQAIALAVTHNAQIMYDEEAQAPYFFYIDEQGRQHEVWFEDARSIQAKFDVVKEYNLRGFFYWVLRWNFPQNWLLVDENFTVNKYV
ncbi:glycosyl hydrolase family 18 protein [Alkalihalobacillus pseudalcaliphilus]|uniref:glycosyl hydrolase family 18 protein n=1 Tax=Alkalihalobacillus pseudalcaliphilus TaxID=79884 RepID=UPI00064D9F34|nr:glycosyl hydrolase family 18 protein [Alkalihalobacillus pseudalcaliphilus]KMK75607.1 spore gernimation protein [Alkalihalobacillus pseudalcaliphilus]